MYISPFHKKIVSWRICLIRHSATFFCGKPLPNTTLGVSEFEIFAILMEPTLVNYNQFDHQYDLPKLKTLLRIEVKVCFLSKIRSDSNWPLSSLTSQSKQNQIEIWYLNDNELIWDFWCLIGPKQPRNYKFELGWVQAKSTQSYLDRFIDFCHGRNFLT